MKKQGLGTGSWRLVVSCLVFGVSALWPWPGVAARTPSAPKQGATISDKPDTPFKLATFEAGGAPRLGLVLGTRIYDIARAS